MVNYSKITYVIIKYTNLKIAGDCMDSENNIKSENYLSDEFINTISPILASKVYNVY